jgi:hypothetical protein
MFHVLKLHNVNCIIGNNDTFINEIIRTYDVDDNTYHAWKIAECDTPIGKPVYMYRIIDNRTGTTYYVVVNNKPYSNPKQCVYDVQSETLNAENDIDAYGEFYDVVHDIMCNM